MSPAFLACSFPLRLSPSGQPDGPETSLRVSPGCARDSAPRSAAHSFQVSGSPESNIPQQGLLPTLSSVRLSPSTSSLQMTPVSCLAERYSPSVLRPVVGFADLRLLGRHRRCPGFTIRLLDSVAGQPPVFMRLDATKKLRWRLCDATHPLSAVPDWRRGNSGSPSLPFYPVYQTDRVRRLEEIVAIP